MSSNPGIFEISLIQGGQLSVIDILKATKPVFRISEKA